MKNLTYLNKNRKGTQVTNRNICQEVSGTVAELRTLPENIQDQIITVWNKLKNREIHPSGSFDNTGRFYAENQELVEDVRSPSRAYPYSEMKACRTKKYVLRCALFYDTKTLDKLIKVV